MRTNIDINDELLQEAMELSQAKTKKEVVERALENYIKMLNRKQILEWPGKVHWEGDLEQMRMQK
ncbi:type II toxin-antitoxin system VapB family antitoxin [Spirosoma sp. BT702]|uniref:Type II toxin-antitoxin system VapB family antitoxin n=1 Tax=Spirosoma profusum TaxID=2771354 RepID=A0A927AU02_9BACT|nr:type II toxin-antitoxin system VapB family antitoxin [Spirosoma profusum]MBD2701742.1 type II toxin-antitoxin system VapB family antitoxin [Spirosoma profusum]